MTPHPAVRTVAIVGLGPAGMRAVERLVHWGHRLEVERLCIDCYDPGPPGGRPLARDLPDFLRCDADALDAWFREGEASADAGQPSFEQWRPAFNAAFDRFPSRRLVGRYFEATWGRLVRLLPSGWELRHLQSAPDDLGHTGDGRWRFGGLRYDEVLVTELGAIRHPDALAAGWTGDLPLLTGRGRGVLAARVPPGSAVAVRGVGPDFLDTVLTLTQGRGGGFLPGRRSHRMAYKRSGRDVAVVYPFAGARRFPDVRPSPDHVPSALAGAPRPPRFAEVASVVDALVDAAADELVNAGVAGPAASADRVSEALARLEAGVPAPGDPRELLEESLRVAFGERPMTPDTALGLAWRWLCPAVHDVVRDEALPAPDRSRLVQLAGALGPLTEGPAPLNGVKLLALVDAGVVDPRSLATARLDAAGIDWPAANALPRPRIDLVVDAAPAPAGFAGLTGGLTGALRAVGVRTAAGSRGLAIGPDAVCAGLPGLAAVGAATKEFTPCAHAQGSERLLDRWARGVLTRALA